MSKLKEEKQPAQNESEKVDLRYERCVEALIYDTIGGASLGLLAMFFTKRKAAALGGGIAMGIGAAFADSKAILLNRTSPCDPVMCEEPPQIDPKKDKKKDSKK